MKLKQILLLSLFSVFFLTGCLDTGKVYHETSESPLSTDSPASEKNDNLAKKNKIAVMGPLSGSLTSAGNALVKSVQLAESEYEIDENKVDLVFADTKCDAETALQEYKKLVAEGIKFIIGPMCSSASIAVISELEKDGVLLLSPGSTNPYLSGGSANFFRLVPSDRFQAKAGAEIFRAADYKKPALVFINNEYGKDLANLFEQNYNSEGAEIALKYQFEEDENDFSSLIAEIAAKEIDSIYLAAMPEAAGYFVKQLRESGSVLPIVATEAVNDEKFLSIAGSSAEGIKITVPFSKNGKIYEDFERSFVAKYAVYPGFFAPESYDAAKLFFVAFDQVGSEFEAVKKFIANTNNYAGASGIISFDQNGDLQEKEYEEIRVRDGKIVSER